MIRKGRNAVPRIGPGRLAAGLLALALLADAPAARAVLVFDAGAPGFTSELAVGGLPFLTAITWAPDGRMFIAPKGGVVRVYENGALLPTPFVDISDLVADSQDRGLLGIAVHPQFPEQPYVYLLYSNDPPGVTPDVDGARVSQLLRVEADPASGYAQALTTPESRVVLLGRNSTYANIGNPADGRDHAHPCTRSPARCRR